MCGISGIVTRKVDLEIPVEWVKNMMAIQQHRGPDDSHYVDLGSALLGFNRLSIQDLSSDGRQPMTLPESGKTIVFNGEIYNFKELRGALNSKKVKLKSGSDTEVLLHLFSSESEKCLERLNGMFGFAVFSPAEGELFAARDRFGIKPFYYFMNDSYFCFASEIKALLTLPFVSREPNRTCLFSSTFRRSQDTTEETCFKDIFQLRPAHRLRLKRDSWNLSFRKYWSLDTSHADERATSRLDDIANEFVDLLTSSVNLRLISDRPVGLLLSGGMDSSSIAASINRVCSNGSTESNLDSDVFCGFYSMSLQGDTLDESNYAKSVAKHLGFEFNRIEVGDLPLTDLVPVSLWHSDEPLDSLNRCVHWHMMRTLAAENIIVVLNGQGGDETMGGYYDRLVGSTLLDALKRSGYAGLTSEWTATRELCGFPARWLLSQVAKNLLGHSMTRFYRSLTHEKALSLAAPGFLLGEAFGGWATDSLPRANDRVNNQLLTWLLRDTVPTLCHYEDRNSAAHGLEERFPFLDYRLAEFMFRLPGLLKTKMGRSKFLLRKTMANFLPDGVVERHSKLGLAVPEDKWIRGPLKALVSDVAGSQSFKQRGFWNYSAFDKLLREHFNNDVNRGNLIWRIICVELWCQTFIDGDFSLTKKSFALQ